MGYVSDQRAHPVGPTSPVYPCGAIVAGVIFALMWQMPGGHSPGFYFWFFLIGWILFFVGYTMFATPLVAFGYELTPDYHERTRLMGTQNFIGQLAYVGRPGSCGS